MFRKLRDQGDGSSGDSAVTAPAPQETPTPEATTPKATPAKGEAGKEPSVADLQAQIANLKKTVGDQGNEIGDYKKTAGLHKQELDTNRAFMDQLKKSPAETLKSLGVAAGLQVTAPSKDPVSTGDAAADQAAQVDAIVKKALAEHMGPVKSVIDTVQESHLAAKYGDAWDELTQIRNSNQMRIQSNQIPISELAHMVSEYDRFSKHIAAAKLVGREELRAELAKKALEHKADPSGQPEGTPPEKEQTVAEGAKRLQDTW